MDIVVLSVKVYVGVLNKMFDFKENVLMKVFF